MTLFSSGMSIPRAARSVTIMKLDSPLRKDLPIHTHKFMKKYMQNTLIRTQEHTNTATFLVEVSELRIHTHSTYTVNTYTHAYIHTYVQRDDVRNSIRIKQTHFKLADRASWSMVPYTTVEVIPSRWKFRSRVCMYIHICICMYVCR